MKKILCSVATLLYALNSFAQKTDPAPYCAIDFQFHYNMFRDFTIGAHTKTFGIEGNVGKTKEYEYFDTEVFPDLPKGTPVTFSLGCYSVDDAEPRYFAIWIDMNQNNTFEASEIVMQNSNTSKQELPVFAAKDTTLRLDITIPASAMTGKTRLRIIRGSKDADLYGPYDDAFELGPCTTGKFNYGCAYDFDVNITDAAGGTAIKDPGGLVPDITLSPMPVTNVLHIGDGAEAGISRTIITDLNGRRVAQYTNGEHDLNISDLIPAIYLLQVYLNNGTIFKSRIVKK